MNTYAKFCPNVYVAKCDVEHAKGETIEVETRHGSAHECIVFNLVAKKPGEFYYSVVRADGFNYQAWCKARAERLQGFAESAAKRSDAHYASARKDSQFLSLGEPIKVGHHSEARHRRAFENSNTQMGKSVEAEKAAGDYVGRAEYWEAKSKEINLSMPESVEYYEYELEKAVERHEGLKSGKYERGHGYSLAYANKARKDAEKRVELARRIWG